jgi:hypothetical protein
LILGERKERDESSSQAEERVELLCNDQVWREGLLASIAIIVISQQEGSVDLYNFK